jgi:hypothetical protein
MILASALFLSALVGCGRSRNDIVGRWQTAGDSGAMVWEFSKDGSVLMGGTRGKYTLGDQERIKIQTSFGTSVYQMEFSGNQMSLKDSSGSKLVFTKQP